MKILTASNVSRVWKRILDRPAIVVLALSLILVVFNLYLAQRGQPYSSDDVSWQNILTTWTPFNGHMVDMGVKDNFIVNVPILLLLGHIFQASRTTIFIDASVLAVINFVLFYVASLYFLKKCNIKATYETLLPFLWIASFGYNFSQLFLNAAWRDFEMGVSFTFFALVIKLYYRELDPFKSWTARVLTLLTLGVAGLFIYSDPYFLYLTIVPIVALFLFLFTARKAAKGQMLLVMSGVIISLVIARVTKTAAARIGLFTPHGHSVSLIPFGRIAHELAATVDEMTTIFGVNISGVRIVSMAGIASILNLLIIIAVATWFVVFIARHYRRQPHKEGRRISPFVLLGSFFGALYIAVFFACLVNGEDDYRYFVISVYALAMIVSFAVGTLKKQANAFVLLIYAATCINIATALFALTPMQKNNLSGNKANSDNYALINEVKQLGLSKGFGNYWDGNINTYLSGGSISFLPVECINGSTSEPLYLLVDTDRFKQPAARTFYVADNTQSNPPSCSERQIIAQFGVPQQIVHLKDKDILVYDYDLVTKMPQV